MGGIISAASGLFSVGCSSLSFCVSCASCCSLLNGSCGISQNVINGFYVIFLGLFMTLGFILRAMGDKFDIHLHSWHIHCTNNDIMVSDSINNIDIYCQGDAAVYRLSFVITAFFAVMAVITFISPSFHNGMWGFKLFGILVVSVVVFFLPNTLFDNSGYAWVARLGSIFFLGLQMLLLIDFSYEWNDQMAEKAFPTDGGEHNKAYIFAMLALSFGLYLTVFVGIPVFFTYYQENLILSGLTLFLIVLLTTLTFTRHIIARNEDLRGQILPAALISAYSMYLLWSALDSDVSSAESTDEYHGIKLAVGATFAVLSLMYTAFSTSNSLDDILANSSSGDDLGQPLMSDSQTDIKSYGSSDRMDYDRENKRHIRNRTVLFHCLMMSASMYMAMLITNWGVNEYNVDKTKQLRHGNVWVKLISQWTIISLYIWSLFAPAILTDRDFD